MVAISLGRSGVGLVHAIAILARQLVEDHRGQTKLTSFYAVLQATTGGAQHLPKNISIAWYGAKRTVEEKDLFMTYWGQQKEDSSVHASRGTTTAVATAKNVNLSDSQHESETGGRDGASSGDDTKPSDIPETKINSVQFLLTVRKAKSGVRRLMCANLAEVLYSCGPRTYKKLTSTWSRPSSRRCTPSPWNGYFSSGTLPGAW